MKIVYYCQHVLGIGHLHRSMEICRALASQHSVTMIAGGPPLQHTGENFAILQLPGLRMDSNFQNLSPYNGHLGLDQVKRQRRSLLFGFFQKHAPDVLIIELYPFGRRAFRFELEPLLEALCNGQLPPCKCYCSLRDILVERENREKFEGRVIAALNSNFAGLLIHGDASFIKLEETFGRVSDIGIPYAYTGYVTPAVPTQTRNEIRKAFGIDEAKPLIIGSIGGGNVGMDLLQCIAEAASHLKKDSCQIKLFTGPYATHRDREILQAGAMSNDLEVMEFSHDFLNWLHAADMSISMAGYNTTMNTLRVGIPALMFPFQQNQEQRLRLAKLCGKIPLRVLHPEDLKAVSLAKLITKQLHEERYSSPIDLEGAANTLATINSWSMPR